MQQNFDIGMDTADTVIRAWQYRKQDIGVTLNLGRRNGKKYFRLLQQQSHEIKSELGDSLEWDEKPNQKDSRITIRNSNTDTTNEEDWQKQYEWLASKVELFYRTFKPRIETFKMAVRESPENGDDE